MKEITLSWMHFIHFGTHRHKINSQNLEYILFKNVNLISHFQNFRGDFDNL